MARRISHLTAFLAAFCALQVPLCSLVCAAPASAGMLEHQTAAEAEAPAPCHEEPADPEDPADCSGDCLESESVAANPLALNVKPPPTSGMAVVSPASSLSRRNLPAFSRGFATPPPPPPDLLLLKSSLIL